MTRRANNPDYALRRSNGGRGPRRWVRIRQWVTGVAAAATRADANAQARNAIAGRDEATAERARQRRAEAAQIKRALGGGSGVPRAQTMRENTIPTVITGPAIGEDGRVIYPQGMSPVDYWQERAELAADGALPFQVTDTVGLKRATAAMQAREKVYLPLEAEYGAANNAEEELLSQLFRAGTMPGDPAANPRLQGAYDAAVDRRVAAEKRLTMEALSDGFPNWRDRRRQYYASQVIARRLG